MTVPQNDMSSTKIVENDFTVENMNISVGAEFSLAISIRNRADPNRGKTNMASF